MKFDFENLPCLGVFQITSFIISTHRSHLPYLSPLCVVLCSARSFSCQAVDIDGHWKTNQGNIDWNSHPYSISSGYGETNSQIMRREPCLSKSQYILAKLPCQLCVWSVQLQCQGDIRSSTDNDIFVAFIDLLKSLHSEQTCEAMLLNISMVI